MKFQSDRSFCKSLAILSLVFLLVIKCGKAEFNVKQLTKLWTLANQGKGDLVQSSTVSAGDNPAVISVNKQSVEDNSSDSKTQNKNKVSEPNYVHSINDSNYNNSIYNFVKRPTQRPEENLKLSRNGISRSVAFKPRSIPISWTEQNTQIERNFFPKTSIKSNLISAVSRRNDKLYRDDVYMDFKKNQSDILFPGNYFDIAEVKRKGVQVNSHSTVRKSGAVYPSNLPVFRPKIIPLLRGSEIRRSGGRSIDRSGMTVALPETIWEQTTYPVISRTIGDFIPEEDSDDVEEEYEDENEEEKDSDDDEEEKKKGHKKIKKKYMKYMLPLLLAYKLKFFTLIPLLMGGLVLLAGSTGLAGFFFALFAAVMGLSKSIH